MPASLSFDALAGSHSPAAGWSPCSPSALTTPPHAACAEQVGIYLWGKKNVAPVLSRRFSSTKLVRMISEKGTPSLYLPPLKQPRRAAPHPAESAAT